MKALIAVDIQNDFLPGGALGVCEGNQIIPIVNKLIEKFDLVVATQDWHPRDHGSFASNHQGKKPGEIISLKGIDQMLWPDHCTQNSIGAEFCGDLNTSRIDRIFQKGTDMWVDSYSGFYDNGKLKDTGLDNFLKSKKVREVYIVGLATDYCVKFTAFDSADLGYQTFLFADATRAVNLHKNDFEKSLDEMRSKGIGILSSIDFKQ